MGGGSGGRVPPPALTHRMRTGEGRRRTGGKARRTGARQPRAPPQRPPHSRKNCAPWGTPQRTPRGAEPWMGGPTPKCITLPGVPRNVRPEGHSPGWAAPLPNDLRSLPGVPRNEQPEGQGSGGRVPPPALTIGIRTSHPPLENEARRGIAPLKLHFSAVASWIGFGNLAESYGRSTRGRRAVPRYGSPSAPFMKETRS